ncbi:MAG: helix-turn-helix transcriptional regulator [Undibacterium sp.]|nr:helix-turn-helix transcriptional regulator [Opitutaceae bacterium]
MVTASTYSVRLALQCTRVRCEPGWHLGPEWAPRLKDYDLWFVSAGRGQMITDHGEVALTPGMGLWMRPGRRYEATHQPTAPLIVNVFHFTLPTAPRGFIPPVEVLRTAHPDFVEAMLRRILALHAKPGPLPRASAEALFGALLGELVRETTARGEETADAGLDRHHREIMQRLAAEIREHPGGARTVAALAKSAGYSVDHFSRVFEKITGQRPQECIIEARLARARQLLAETGLTVSQIAEALGFRDVFFFSRQFTQRTGQTPSAYRAALSRPHRK